MLEFHKLNATLRSVKLTRSITLALALLLTVATAAATAHVVDHHAADCVVCLQGAGDDHIAASLNHAGQVTWSAATLVDHFDDLDVAAFVSSPPPARGPPAIL